MRYLIALLALLTIAAGCSRAPARTAAPPAKTVKQQIAEIPPHSNPYGEDIKGLHCYGRWQGNGVKNSEPFTISSEPWVIGWATGREGIFQLYLYRRTGELVAVVANAQGEASDEYYVYNQTGEFYLSINATQGYSCSVYAGHNDEALGR